MNKRPRVLLAPDPRLLPELFPEELCAKITKARLCFVIDDDGTISDSFPPYADWLTRKLGRPVNPEDCTRYDFSDIDRRALGMLKVGVFSNAGMHRNLPLVPGAAEALQEIYQEGIAIVILTARPPSEEMKRATYDHKVRNQIPFDLMIFSPRKKEIIKAIKKLGCRVVVVDDDPSVITSVYQLAGVVAILFGARYNEHIKREGLIRVARNGGQTAWEEVLSIVRRKIINGRS